MQCPYAPALDLRSLSHFRNVVVRPVKPNVIAMRGGAEAHAPRIRFSPLRVAALTRLGLVAVISAGLWLAIVWAITT
jgi:hypothetical protein